MFKLIAFLSTILAVVLFWVYASSETALKTPEYYAEKTLCEWRGDSLTFLEASNIIEYFQFLAMGSYPTPIVDDCSAESPTRSIMATFTGPKEERLNEINSFVTRQVKAAMASDNVEQRYGADAILATYTRLVCSADRSCMQELIESFEPLGYTYETSMVFCDFTEKPLNVLGAEEKLDTWHRIMPFICDRALDFETGIFEPLDRLKPLDNFELEMAQKGVLRSGRWWRNFTGLLSTSIPVGSNE